MWADPREIVQAVRSLVLQPHSDDAVFNTWALMRAGLIPLPAAVVSVFSRSSHLVSSLQAESIDEISAIRRLEDRIAWSDSPGVHTPAGMGFPDLPDRDLSTPDEVLTKEVACHIRQLLGESPADFLVAQYATGPEAHPDHRIVHSAALRVSAEIAGVTLLLTQDAPYSVIDPADEELLDLGYRPIRIGLSTPILRRKHRALEAYASQMRPEFHDFVERKPWEALWVPRQGMAWPSTNASQLDTNEDGYGSAYDADYNDDGIVGAHDFISLSGARDCERGVDGCYDPDFDMDDAGRGPDPPRLGPAGHCPVSLPRVASGRSWGRGWRWWRAAAGNPRLMRSTG